MDTSLNQKDIGSTNSPLQADLLKGKSSFAAGPSMFLGVTITLFSSLLLFYGFYYPLHHDLAGSVLSGQLAVSLGDAFRDYSIYFPPSEKLWFSIAAHLSDFTGLRLDLVIVMMTGVVVLFGSGLAFRIRQITVGASPLFFIGSVVILTIAPILFKNVFGLREHLIASGLWPYLVLRISDPDGTRIGWKPRAILGLWMGALLLFKYLYCAVVVLVELADSLVQRRLSSLFRLENILAATVVFVYLLFWLGVDPTQRTAIGAMFSAIDANLIEPRENLMKVIAGLNGAIFILVASRVLDLPKRPLMIGFAVVAGSIIAAAAQERWYTHHLFPITLAYLFWWWISFRKFRWWAHAIMALLVLVPVGREYLSMSVYHKQLAELEQSIADGKQSVKGKRVAILNMHPSPYNQYLVSHYAARWTPMMNNAYVSAELQSYDLQANAGKFAPPVKLTEPGRRLLHEQMLRLWEDQPPDVIILDRTSRWPLRYIRVDWTRVFSQDPQFTKILRQYRPVLVYDGARIRYTYYVRAN